MAETRYQDLSADGRRDALEVAEHGGSHRAHLLEKDIRVVAALGVLFDARFASAAARASRDSVTTDRKN